jgi:hypothetical protein
MATIRLKRTSEYNNRMRDGETKDFPTTEGQHTVTAKIDWCSSPNISVDINDNQTKNLKAGSFRYGQILIPIGLVIILLHFILSKFADFEYIIFLDTHLFLLFIYYLTIGRKKYLTLEEINDN